VSRVGTELTAIVPNETHDNVLDLWYVQYKTINVA
jgi:hypothetical protein